MGFSIKYLARKGQLAPGVKPDATTLVKTNFKNFGSKISGG
jgi:hypothetical protein